ncbi:MAG: glycosyltransferase family 39 protein [Chloroflexi bacterium]|nr:glycosyltransferase family 39 protein [Chloroflexota bacterium]
MDTRNSRSRLLALLLAAFTILFLIIVQAHHFHNRPYRQDEAWVVHYALANIERVGFIPHILRPLRLLHPENFLQDIWVHLFGHVENIVRYFSSLVTILTLAALYRLAADIFDRQTGWLALLLLGTYGIFTYYSHEARPYALLAFGAVSFPWMLLRFIQKPDLKRGVCAVLPATVIFYAHPFMAFVIAAQFLCVLIFVRWDRELYRRGIALFLIIAVLVGYRAYINYADRGGVIQYNMDSSWDGLLALYDYFRFNPESLGLLLLLGGVATFLVKLGSAWLGPDSIGDPAPAAIPARSRLDSRMRWPYIWREGWLVLSIIVMLALPLVVNAYSPSLTPRNMLILAPSLALIAAIALRQVPRHIQLLALFFFCISFVTQFHTYPFYNGNAGYWELAAYLEDRFEQSRDRLVVVTAQLWESIPINYFLQERSNLKLTPQEIYNISGDTFVNDPFVPPSIDVKLTATSYGPDDWERLRDYLGDSERLWLIKGNPYLGGQNMLDAIGTEYTLYSAVDFPGETYYRALEVLEYRRQPDVTAPLWRFGEDVNLLHWRLNDGHIVRPCQQISVDTWWSTEVEIDQLYSTTLVLAGADGNGIANADDMPGGIYLTTAWQPDQFYFDERLLAIPCDLADGDYPLLLGMYAIPRDDRPLKILPIHTGAGKATGRQYEYLTTLLVRR